MGLSIRSFLVELLATTSYIGCYAQLHNDDVCKLPYMDRLEVRKNLSFPQVNGYQILKCDFHIHTLFSDGRVWPTERVSEAWRNGLDAIAITDHIEVRRFEDFVKGDFNTSYDIAKRYADEINFICIKGAEITRAKPFGHMNALFIHDANKLNTETPEQAITEALKQDAFILWNHPGWPDNNCKMYDIQRRWLKKGKIHGIELFNEYEYYPRSIDWCRDFKVAYFANSDAHKSIDHTYSSKSCRPLTLVLAKEKSEQSIREALFAGRTVAYFNNTLVGNENLLTEMVKAYLSVCQPSNEKRFYEVKNISAITFSILIGERMVLIPGLSTVRVSLKVKPVYEKMPEYIIVKNCLTGNGKLLRIKL